MMYFSFLVLGALILIFAILKREKKIDYLAEYDEKTISNTVFSDQQAVDLKSLSKQSIFDRIKLKYKNLQKQLGSMPELKIIAAIAIITSASIFINDLFIRENIFIVAIIINIFGLVLLYNWLQKREFTRFESAFPDALSMMTSAISSGESVMHSIMYVGDSLEGEVGKEFKLMGKRLQVGEPIDEVFRKSCVRFPYPSFFFFVICLRANMQRGGQLKDLMMRLNRMMFNARSIDKKKFAMTAEARMSVKIVAAIPIFFLMLLRYLSPENYNYVMFDPNGRMVLYYVLVSEFIGISIVWWLMKGIK